MPREVTSSAVTNEPHHGAQPHVRAQQQRCWVAGLPWRVRVGRGCWGEKWQGGGVSPALQLPVGQLQRPHVSLEVAVPRQQPL